MKKRSSSSNKNKTNMWYQIPISASNQRTKFVGFTLQTCDFICPLTKWHFELRKGVLVKKSLKRISPFHAVQISDN